MAIYVPIVMYGQIVYMLEVTITIPCFVALYLMVSEIANSSSF